MNVGGELKEGSAELGLEVVLFGELSVLFMSVAIYKRSTYSNLIIIKIIKI